MTASVHEIESSLDLKKIGKQRIVHDMIRRVRNSVYKRESNELDAQNPLGLCVMLVDTASLKVLSSFCNTYDLLEEGITVVEDIAKYRQPMPKYEAIYYISPTIESVNLLCQDFPSENHHHYNGVHIFFVLPIDNPRILELIALCPTLLKHLKTFVEFNLGFIAYERRVFHFDTINPLTRLFPSNKHEALFHVDKLLSVFLTLGDKPIIRFHANSFGFNELLATTLHKRLKQCTIPGLTQGRTTLIIVDRSIDIAPLFVHEYTYQAYIYDILNIPLRTKTPPKESESVLGEGMADTIKYMPLTSEDKSQPSIALLSENDSVYVKYRHQHLKVVLKQIPQEIKKFFNENAAACFQKNEDMTNEEMHAAIRDLPEYEEMLSKYNLHNSIIQRCFNEFNNKQIAKIGPVEQDVACGVNMKGKPLSTKKLQAAMNGILSDSTIGNSEKLRLLLLYMSMMTGMHEEEQRKLIVLAELSLENSQCIRNFTKIGLTPPLSPISTGKEMTHNYTGKSERLKFFSRRAKSIDIPLARFQPYIKTLMEDAIRCKLHGGKFQLVAQGEDANSSSVVLPPDYTTTSHVLQAKNKNWDFSNSSDSESVKLSGDPASTIKSEGLPPNCDRALVIFVVGGVTLSETRSAYEVSRQLGRNVFIGGSCILTPKVVLDEMKSYELAQV